MDSIEHTKNWIKSVVIGLNLCPFAAKPFLENKISYYLADSYHPASIAEDIITLLKKMDTDLSVETAFFLLPDGYEEFEELLDLHELCKQALHDEGYTGIYQLVTFHPNYLFEGEEPEDPANYTNRSPYPMFHIIREESLSRIIALYPDSHLIPHNNIKLCRAKGLDYLNSLLLASQNR